MTAESRQEAARDRANKGERREPKRRVGGVLLLAAAALVLWPVASRAAVVKGRTQGVQKLVNPVWNEAKETSANRYTWREPSPTVRAEFRALFPSPRRRCASRPSARRP